MNARIRKYLPWGILIVSFILLTLVTASRIFIRGIVDADMASELVLCRQLFEERSLLSANWYYSTEIRVLGNQLIFTPLFALFSSWQMIRFVGTVLLHALLVVSYLFMAKCLKLGRWSPAFAGLILLPISGEYFYFVLYGAFYLPYIITSFFVLGLLFYKPAKKVRQRVATLALAMLSFCAGLNGMRQLLVLFVPLFLSTLLYTFQVFDRCANKESRSTALRPLGLSTLSLLLSVIGAGVNQVIFTRIYHFQTFGNVTYTQFSFESLGRVLQGILSAFGYQAGGLLFGADTLYNGACAMLVLVFIIALYGLLRHRSTLRTSKAILVYFFVCALCTFTLLYVFTNMSYAVRYSMPILVFAFPIIQIYLNDISCSKTLRNTLIGMLVLSLCASTALLYRYNLQSAQPHERKVVTDLLVKEGCSAGYATFGNANILTEYSDGALDVYMMQSRESGSPTDLVKTQQATAHFRSTPEGKVFVLLNQDEYELFTFAQYLPAENLAYSGNKYVAFIFDSDEYLRSLLPR